MFLPTSKTKTHPSASGPTSHAPGKQRRGAKVAADSEQRERGGEGRQGAAKRQKRPREVNTNERHVTRHPTNPATGDEDAATAAASDDGSDGGNDRRNEERGAREGRGIKVIAYSLYGSEVRYTRGILANAELGASIFRGWRLRVYHDSSVPTGILSQLLVQQVELVNMTGSPLNKMTWRFLPAAEKGVERFCSRDADSHLSARERDAVEAWEQSGKLFYVLRDHPSHSNFPMPGGLWCAAGGAVPDMLELLLEHKESLSYTADMDFLAKVIWPRAQGSLLQHDSFSCITWRALPFPTPRKHWEMVGGRFDPSLGRVCDQDVALLKNASVPETCLPPSLRRHAWLRFMHQRQSLLLPPVLSCSHDGVACCPSIVDDQRLPPVCPSPSPPRPPGAPPLPPANLNLARERILLLRMNPFMGFANRMWAISSALVLALVSERCLLIDWPSHDAPVRAAGEVHFMPPLQHLLTLPLPLSLPDVMSTYADKDAAMAGLKHDEESWMRVDEESGQLLEVLCARASQPRVPAPRALNILIVCYPTPNPKP